LLQEAYANIRQGALNLLQGAYAPRKDWQAVLKVWRRAAVLSGAAAAAFLALFIVDSLRLQHDAAAATARAEAAFRQALPEVGRVVNPRAQIRAHLQDMKAQASNGFLLSSDMLVGVIAENEGVALQVLRFD